MREITIRTALNGWTAHVGCQTLVYIDKDALLKDLDQYMADPKAKEKEFVEAAINKRLVTEGCPTPEAPPATRPQELATIGVTRGR